MIRKLPLLLGLGAMLSIAARPALAQINLTATGGAPAGSFSTLKASFDAINAGTHTDVIAITINGGTTETVHPGHCQRRRPPAQAEYRAELYG